jgi:hypothetical protein
VVTKPSTPGTPVKLPRSCVALQYPKKRRTKVGVFDDTLVTLLNTTKAKSQFTAVLAKARVIGNGHGHAGTVQVRVPVLRDDKKISKPRVWEMVLNRLCKFANRP